MKLARLLTVLAFAFVPAFCQQPSTIPAADLQGINTTLEAVGDSLTAMDFVKFGTLFTGDCDFVNVVGMHWVGKAQVVKAHSIIFTTRYHGYPQHIVGQTASLLTPNIALVVDTIKMDDYTAQDGKRMTNNLSRMTWILEKHNGTWLVRSGHNTTIDPEAAKHDPIHPV